jgi:hypothetical protein
MNHIKITTQGTRGGNTKCNNAGYALIQLRHEQDRITIDDFEGTGETYKQREQQLIEIVHNGKILFSGTKWELFYILENSRL